MGQKSFSLYSILSVRLPPTTEILLVKIPSVRMLLVGVYIPPGLCVSDMEDISEFFTNVLDSELSL